MYALNDLTDARRDLDNPRKDHALARDLSTYRASFAALLSAGHALAIAAAFAFAGARCGTATIAVFAVNALYSRFFKGIPILDVVVVGLWGAAYAAIVAPLPLVVPVGAMTAACHVFQATGDRDADLRAGVTTTAASPRLALLALAISSAALVFGLRALGWLALAGALPLVAGLVLRGSRSSWTASKIAFGAVWILLLWRLHGSH
jgi:4-hydroxybenzoate polyprenyltransferase